LLEWIADYRVLEALEDPSWSGTRVAAAPPERLGPLDGPVVVELVPGEPAVLQGWLGRWAIVAARSPGLAVPLEVGPAPEDAAESFVARRTGGTAPASLDALAGAAAGLAALHRAGLVHGAVVPARLLAGTGGGTLDLPPVDASSAPALLAPSAAALDTVAPEVLRGEPASLASDVWSLGACVLRLVTGRPVHPGIDQDVLLGGVARVMAERPATDDVTGPLAGLVGACLRLDPDERPEAAAVADALRHGAGGAA
jgi:hypothetical protein